MVGQNDDPNVAHVDVAGAIEFLQCLQDASKSSELRKAISSYLAGETIADSLRSFEEAEKRSLKPESATEILLSEHVEWRRKLRVVSRLVNENAIRGALLNMAKDETTADKIRFFTMMMNKSRYAEDLFASRAAADWLDTPEFKQAYEAGSSISTWKMGVRWRVYTLMKAAKNVSRLEGDYVECGVNNGGTAMSVITHLGAEAFRGRRFYLFDTFQGLVDEQRTEIEKTKFPLPEGHYPNVLEGVRRNFSKFDFADIVVGAVPETLSHFKGDKVAYVHIDMNVALPEVEAFKYFWPRLSPGGVVVFDDYGFPAHVEQQKALNEAARDFGAEIMMLPTGQGIVWK